MNNAAETDIAALTAQLERTQRELQDLHFAIGHDLRAPLRVVTGFSQALREHIASSLDATGQHFLTRIDQATQQLSAMIEGLLQLSRLNQTEPHPALLDVSTLCRELAAEIAPHFTHAPELSIADNMHLQADAALLRTALRALLDNAWKFTQQRIDAQIRVSASRTTGEFTLCVHDNGMGIDMNYAQRLFVPFQHLHARAELKGVGLGLASAQRIAALHGGSMRAEGTLNEFAAFYVTLPQPDASPS